jgi:zinc protease
MKTQSIRNFFLLLLMLFTVSVFAQKQQPPEGGPPKDFNLPAKKVNKLPNGLASVLVQYGTMPKVTVDVIVKTGSLHEAADQVWLSDLTGRLMKEGTTTLNSKQIAQKVASMGGDLSIDVGAEQTSISAAVLSEYAPELVKLLADVTMNPSFPASEIERLKTDLKRQLSVQKAVPQNQAREKFFAVMYKDHPYGRTYPTEEMLTSYSIDKVKSFYNSNFGAQRTRVYVVGKFDEASVSKAINDAFAKWTKGPEVSYPPAKASDTPDKAVIDRPGAPQTTIMLGLPSLDPSNPNYVPLRVTNALLGGSFGSRITRNIREDKGYTYSPNSAIQPGYRTAVWYEQADVTTEHTIDSVHEIQKEITRLQSEPPSADELKGIQNYLAGVFVLQNSSQSGIIGQLNFLDLHGLPDSYLTNFVKNVYAVTPAQVQQIAKEDFSVDKLTMVMVGDQKQIETQQQAAAK